MHKLILVVFMLSWPFSGFALEVLPKQPPIPAENQQTPEKIALGKLLFFDPRLSIDGSVSCSSCHSVFAGGEDNRPNSVGIKGQVGGRSAPTVWNAAFMTALFWDGRAAKLEDQAKGPLTNPIEMGMPSHDAVVERLVKISEYADEFAKAFPSEPMPINIDNVAKAIASYERTLVTPDSPVDRYLAGETNAISALAKRGLELVENFGCTSCHSGVNYAGPKLPQGAGFYQYFPVFSGSKYEMLYKLKDDFGRYNHTKVESDKHRFRVPTLRNVALTSPYFHNGSVSSLEEAVRVMGKTQLDLDISDQDVSAIVEFLKGLTGVFPDQTMPRLPATPGTNVLAE